MPGDSLKYFKVSREEEGQQATSCIGELNKITAICFYFKWIIKISLQNLIWQNYATCPTKVKDCLGLVLIPVIVIILCFALIIYFKYHKFKKKNILQLFLRSLHCKKKRSNVFPNNFITPPFNKVIKKFGGHRDFLKLIKGSYCDFNVMAI